MGNDSPGGSGDLPEQGKGNTSGDMGLGLSRLRPQSMWAVQQFVRLMTVEAVPAFLVLEKGASAGGALEAHFLPTLIVDTRDHYRQKVSTR